MSRRGRLVASPLVVVEHVTFVVVVVAVARLKRGAGGLEAPEGFAVLVSSAAFDAIVRVMVITMLTLMLMLTMMLLAIFARLAL